MIWMDPSFKTSDLMALGIFHVIYQRRKQTDNG